MHRDRYDLHSIPIRFIRFQRLMPPHLPLSLNRNERNLPPLLLFLRDMYHPSRLWGMYILPFGPTCTPQLEMFDPLPPINVLRRNDLSALRPLLLLLPRRYFLHLLFVP
jgi:hypothetical protein